MKTKSTTRLVRCDIKREMSDEVCKNRTFIKEAGLHDIVFCNFKGLPYCEFYICDVNPLDPNKDKDLLHQ